MFPKRKQEMNINSDSFSAPTNFPTIYQKLNTYLPWKITTDFTLKKKRESKAKEARICQRPNFFKAFFRFCVRRQMVPIFHHAKKMLLVRVIMYHDYMAEKSSSETRVEETNLNFRKHFDGKAAERAKKNWHWGKMKREKFPRMIYASSTLNTVSGFCFEWCWQHLCKLDLLRWLPLMATIQTLRNSNNPRPRILGIGAFFFSREVFPAASPPALFMATFYCWHVYFLPFFTI